MLRQKKIYFFCLILFILLTLKLFYNYKNIILTFDESTTLQLTDYSLNKFIKIAKIQENGPFLYQFILKIIKKYIKTQYYNYRIISIIFGLLSYLLGVLIVIKLYDKKTIVVFSFVFLFSVYYHDFFQTIKPYAFIIFLTYLNLFFYLYYFDKHKFIQSILFVVGMYTAYYFFFFILSFNLYILHKKKIKDMIYTLVIPIILYLPWLHMFFFHLHRVKKEYWVEPVNFMKISSAFYWYCSSSIYIFSASLISIIYYLYKKYRFKNIINFIIISLTIPFIFYILAFYRFNIYYYRYFIGCVIFFYLGISALISKFNNFFIILILFFFLIGSYKKHKFYYIRHKNFFKQTTEFMKTKFNVKKMYHSNVYTYFSFKFLMPNVKHFISYQTVYPHYNVFILIKKEEYFDVKKIKPKFIICRKNGEFMENKEYFEKNYVLFKRFGRVRVFILSNKTL